MTEQPDVEWVYLGEADEGDIAGLTYQILLVIEEAVDRGVTDASALLAVYDVLDSLEELPQSIH